MLAASRHGASSITSLPKDGLLSNMKVIILSYFKSNYFSIYSINFTCRSAVCDEIIRCRGDQVRLAVRARVFPYPEETNAVWIMFAVKYKSIL